MNCALCLVHGSVPNPATTILNGQAVCAQHIQDVVAAPGAQGVTVSRMRATTGCATCKHDPRLHHKDVGCAAGVGGGELCGCDTFVERTTNGQQKVEA